MLTKNDIKLIRSLSDRKERQERQLFVAEGDKACRDLMGSKISIKTVYATTEWLRQYTQIVPADCQQIEVSERELGQLSRHAAPQKVIIVAHIPQNDLSSFTLNKGLALVLDNLQDPGNLGTIIRTADWYGIQHIFCSRDTVDAYNPKVVDSTMGSIGRVNLRYVNLEELLTRHSDIPVYGAMLNGESVYSAQLQTPAFLIIGNEGRGISQSIQCYVTHPLHIPGKGKAESLNAAIATAILCDHFARQAVI
jgi:TrmH family RNA methyltransferase